MSVKKATVTIGYTSGNIYEDYKHWSRKRLVGADITATDGQGNTIQLNVREEPHGFRVELNGKVIADSFKGPSA